MHTSPYDSHPEHQHVAQLARQTARKNNLNLWYMDHAIPGGHNAQAPRPNHFVTFDDFHKYDAIECYNVMDQQTVKQVMYRDRYYGGMVGAEFAEGFIVAHSVT